MAKQRFIVRFEHHADSSHTPPAVDRQAGEFQTVMPCTMCATMIDEDLSASYDLLRTLKPVENMVQRWEAGDRR
jgi:hypothetical protein